MRKFLPIFVIILIGLSIGYLRSTPEPVRESSSSHADMDKLIERAYQKQMDNLQVEGIGVVTRILADDQKGRRHQKFLVRLSSGQTLLIVHNIDLAPRISGLRPNDIVNFYGEYEYNEKGGLIHWTHHDPKGRHVGGWIKHKGRTYQ